MVAIIKNVVSTVVKRAQAVFNSSCLPAVNFAVGVYQSIHLFPALCEPTGIFSRAVDSAIACIAAHPVTNQGGIQDVSLDKPCSYCSINFWGEVTALIDSSSSECASYASTGDLGPAELGCTLTLADGSLKSWKIEYSSVSQPTDTYTTSANSSSIIPPIPPSTVTAYIVLSAPTSTPPATEDHSLGTGTIAGIAVGATLAVVIILGSIIFFAWRIRRKRKNKRAAEVAAVAESEEKDTKPQLHSDDYKPTREELEGSKVPLKIREIAGVHEIEHQDLAKVRTEMSANEVAASEMDSPDRIRMSPTAEGSTLLGSSVRSEGGR